jgi:hypothetical protein
MSVLGTVERLFTGFPSLPLLFLAFWRVPVRRFLPYWSMRSLPAAKRLSRLAEGHSRER